MIWLVLGIWLVGALAVFANIFPMAEHRAGWAIVLSVARPLLMVAAAVIALNVFLWERSGGRLFNAKGTPR